PSNVAARCVHVFSGSCTVPDAPSLKLAPVRRTYVAGFGSLSLAYNTYASPADVSLKTTVLQPLRAVGFTHASSVIPVDRSSDAASATVTQLLTPLKLSADPKRPDVVRVAPLIVPVLLLPERSMTVAPEPSSKPYAAMRLLAAELATVTVTAADVVLFPAASRATAVNTRDPFVAPSVFHEIEYGLATSSAPSAMPSSMNWTPATPMLSLADAETVTVPVTVALAAGLVMDTDGAVTSTTPVVNDQVKFAASRFPARSFTPD